MKRWILHVYILLFACLLSLSKLIAQQAMVDSGYIRSFDKPNVIELYPGWNTTHFYFTSQGERKNDYRLVANSSGYVGSYLNYKWLSLKYSWIMPGTQLDKNVKLRYTSLNFRFTGRQIGFNPFFDAYNGLLIPSKKHSKSFEPLRDIQFTDAGADFYFFTNTKKFSFKAANYFSESQIKSAGACFMMTSPMWQKINLRTTSTYLIPDSATYHLLSSGPKWLSLIARIGYTYNFIFSKSKWSIAPAIAMGGGGLKEINTTKKYLQLVTDIQAWLNAGYNGRNYYCYFNAWWENLQANLLIKNFHQVNTDFSITAGCRFPSLNRRILSVL